MKIAIIDYGMGNLHSVLKSMQLVASEHAEVVLTSDAATIAAADKVVFPGQGAMPDCMGHLSESGLIDSVRRAAEEKPFLGICVGAQLMFERSAEGPTESLGIFQGEVVRFPADRMLDAAGQRLKVPHMGWNNMYQRRAHPLWNGIADGERFYFVHSYHFAPAEDIAVIEAEYPYRFAAAVARDNIFAIQCHPEKSSHAGLQLLKNFVHWDGKA